MSATQDVVREFGGSRTAMAAEIVRLRERLEEVRFDLGRAALAGVSGVLLDPLPPADRVPRPIGFRPSPGNSLARGGVVEWYADVPHDDDHGEVVTHDD